MERETKNKSESVNRVDQSRAVNLATRTLTPRSDGKPLGKSEHFVQFYETDSFLLNSLTEFVGAGLRAGNAVIVIGTKARRQSLAESLRESELDLRDCRASGQYI